MIARLAIFLGSAARAVQPRTNQRGFRNLYVIRLDDAVLRKRKFRERNPGYQPGKPCVYGGQTSLDPDDRFQQHKDGDKASPIARKYGNYLMRKRYEHLNPVPAAEAEDREEDLAAALQRKATECGGTDGSDTITTATTQSPGKPPCDLGSPRLSVHSGPPGRTEQGNRKLNRATQSRCTAANSGQPCVATTASNTSTATNSNKHNRYWFRSSQ